MDAASLVHLVQAALSAYTLYPTYLSITRTQTYEATTEKAAQYSNTAEWHLWKTRKTLGIGTVGVIASLLTSATFMSNPSTGSSISFSAKSNGLKVIASLALAGGLTFSHTHISNYWRAKAKVPAPGMGDYNDAISSTARMRRCIGLLAASWALMGVIYGGQALF